MKKIMTKKAFLCTTLTTMLVFGNCTGSVAYAAPGDALTEPEPQTQEALTEEETVSNTILSDEELAAYYSDSVFIGDSIMAGFRNYSAKQDSYVHDIAFLAVGSYSAFNAMKPVAGDNVHPMYKGKKCQVWNAVPLIGSKRAFILLGMNDISILGLEGSRDQYKQLIDKILETSPDIEIHIISVTYTLRDQGKGKLNNDNIAKYNVLLQEMAEENGWGYLDLCTPISDGEGNLAKEYCSDGFVHLSRSAYALWESELIDYANAQADQKESETESETNANEEKADMTNAGIEKITGKYETEETETDSKKDMKSKIETTFQTIKGRSQS